MLAVVTPPPAMLAVSLRVAWAALRLRVPRLLMRPLPLSAPLKVRSSAPSLAIRPWVVQLAPLPIKRRAPSSWPVAVWSRLSTLTVSCPAWITLLLVQLPWVMVRSPRVTRLPPTSLRLAGAMPKLPVPTCRTLPPRFWKLPALRVRSLLAVSSTPLRLSNRPPMSNSVVPAVPSARRRPVWLSRLAARTLRVLSLSIMPRRLLSAPLRSRSICWPAIWPSLSPLLSKSCPTTRIRPLAYSPPLRLSKLPVVTSALPPCAAMRPP